MNQRIVSYSISSFLCVSSGFQPGKYFLKRSFKWSDSLSGNWMSKLTIKSPLRLTSLGLGKPLPTMRLTVLGCTTSSCKLTTIRSPPNKGISARAPQRACKMKEKKILVNHFYNLFSLLGIISRGLEQTFSSFSLKRQEDKAVEIESLRTTRCLRFWCENCYLLILQCGKQPRQMGTFKTRRNKLGKRVAICGS